MTVDHLSWHLLIRRYLLWTVLAHMAWEVVQLPLYTLWADETLLYNAFAVVHCTGGDLLIALAALMIAVVTVGSREWPRRAHGRVVVVATLIGVGYTVYSEWLSTGVRASWAYTDAMPALPPLGTGLTPFLQWVILPPLGLWLCARDGDASGETRTGPH